VNPRRRKRVAQGQDTLPRGVKRESEAPAIRPLIKLKLDCVRPGKKGPGLTAAWDEAKLLKEESNITQQN